MRRRLIAGGAASLLVVALSACGVPQESSAQLVPDRLIPEALDPSDPAPVTSFERQRSISLWFIRGSQLVRVPHTVPASTSHESVIDELLAGPTDSERNDSLRSAIPDAAAIDQVTISRGEANVALSEGFAEIPAADQLLAVGQLVLTLTDFRGVGSVRFTIDGQPAPVPLPDGGISSEPVTRDDYINQAEENP